MRILATLTVSWFLSTLTFGQQSNDEFRCLANNPYELDRHLSNTPGALEHALEAKARLDRRTENFSAAEERGGDDPYIIPVVFHVIHNNGPENITDVQIYDAVRILNEDFNKQNPDWQNVRPGFLDIVGDIGIEFRLARLDPQGNCTNGITRTISEQTNDGDFEMTQLIQWPRDRYMNIWVAASAGDGIAGYTYYPQWLDDWAEADGIVVGYIYVGSIGTGSLNGSRVLSHEVGHWLNLAHCWGSTNEPGVATNCNSDDGVADTPNTIGWTACVLSGTSCGSTLDNVENYMEYASCRKMFTIGQGDRMIAALTSNVAERSSLWQPSNLAQTGVSADPVLCVAQFTHGPTQFCAGGTVQFQDNSYNTVTQRTWSFPGGSPATSSDSLPTVQYDTPGVYPVTLQVSDGINDLTVEEQGLVIVYSDPGLAAPVEDGFEAYTSVPNNDWVVNDNDLNGTFQLTTDAAYGGVASIKLANSSSTSGSFDNLYSPTYDLTSVSQLVVTFRYAFAQRFSSNDDRLRFYVSNNCGESWSLRKHLRANIDLTTGGIVNGTFIPNDDEWGFAVVDNISTSYHTSDFRIRFEFESDGGNTLYIDDINILSSPVGVNELTNEADGVMIVPNPVTDQAYVRFDTFGKGQVQLNILDITGRTISTVFNGTLGVGPQKKVFSTVGLSAGAYFLRIIVNGNVRTIRFTVDRRW